MNPDDHPQKKILVVEDDQQIRENLVELLQISGYDVFEAVDGEDGFFKTIRHNPNIILSDLMMPRMSGYDLLEGVRSHPKLRFTPFIILSARSELDSIREGMRMGADDYLVKPYDEEELLKCIEYRLSHQQEFAQLVMKAEQDRLRMDLHDHLQQTIVALKMNTEHLIHKSKTAKPIAVSELETIKDSLEVAFIQLRNLIDGSPSERILVDGFKTTLDKMVECIMTYSTFNIRYENSLLEDPKMQLTLEVIPILSEVLTNAIKHSKAKNISLTVQKNQSNLDIYIDDDGIGFMKSQLQSRGVQNISTRVGRANGSLEFDSLKGVGTSYEMTFENAF